ncbi:hypothetical protein [Pedobacter gandavensis]|uniref:hypothetical protein n=1 Tax=Pedobacter gandavensis TaxID=2679963 RepID=UPI00292D4127|nr:hypothetical protein [Pedobacter gandavensis]
MKSLKIQLLVTTLITLSFFACNSSIQNNIPGTYINRASSEFSIAFDTLIVEHNKGNDYLIHRKTGVQIIDNTGKAGKMLYETEELMGSYNEDSKILIETRKGREISFDIKKGLLMLEKGVFKRIN